MFVGKLLITPNVLERVITLHCRLFGRRFPQGVLTHAFSLMKLNAFATLVYRTYNYLVVAVARAAGVSSLKVTEVSVK